MKTVIFGVLTFALATVISENSHSCHSTVDQDNYLDSMKAYCVGNLGAWVVQNTVNPPRVGILCTFPSGGQNYFSYALHCPVAPPADPVTAPGASSTARLAPNSPYQSCIRGSVVRAETRVVEENVPIAGTPFRLNYSSGRAFARSAMRTKYMNSYIGSCAFPFHDYPGGSYPTPSCASRKFEGSVAGTGFSVSIPNSNPNGFNYIWNGLDNTGNVVLGSALFSLDVTDIPAYPTEKPLEYREPIGSFYPIALGLGGWTIDAVHFYDVNLKMVFRGNGSAYKAIAKVLPGPQYLVPEEDGSIVYIFDSTGRHIQTKTSVKGTTILTISYAAGKISTIADAFSNITTVNYNGSGLPVSIVGPYGHTTTMTTDAKGYFTTITNPSSETYTMSYDGATGRDGLMLTFQKPSGVTATMTYDSEALLMSDSISGGGSTYLYPTTVAGELQTTSPMNVATKYSFIARPSNTTRRKVDGPGPITYQEDYQYFNDGVLSNVTAMDDMGMRFYSNKVADPRFPSAKFDQNYKVDSMYASRILITTKTATLSNSADPFSVVSLGETSTLNSTKTSTLSYLASNSTYTKTSHLGRQTFVTVDTYERPTAIQYSTYTPVNFTYDTRGRIETVGQGSARTSTFTYDTEGNLQTVTNPLSQMKTFAYDSVGRLTSETLPDSRVISYTYDVNGNLASVTPPNGFTHAFLSNGFDLLAKYTAPAVNFFGFAKSFEAATTKVKKQLSSPLQKFANWLKAFFPMAAKKMMLLPVNPDTVYVYNNDRKLTSVTRPNGSAANFVYNTTTGRLSSITTPLGNYTFNQYAYYNRTDAITSPDGVIQNYTYDSRLITGIANSGTSSGSVTMTYNTEFMLASTKVNTATAVSYTYNNDSLMTAAGSEVITRTASTGFPTVAAVDDVSENYTYSSGYGELASIQGKYLTTTLYQEVLTRDNLARVTSKTETVGAAASDVYDYTFDSAGRLTTVLKNSAPFASYVYDSNSNRTSVTRGAVTTNATYDEQDRIVTYGTKTYAHNDAGELTGISDSATSPASVTTYTYDVFGNIKSATLPNGTVISYLLDGQNRRVARKVNNVNNKRFVWFDQLRLAGELDGTGTLVSQFIYGLKSNVPDYIIKGGVKYKVITDHLGSVVAVVNSTTGVAAQTLSYDEFGRVLSDTSPGFQPFGFAGGLYDPDTKLTLFGARSYDAEIGRWLSKDPILFGGGDTNLYGYVLNDPINLIDPFGLRAFDPSENQTPLNTNEGVRLLINSYVNEHDGNVHNAWSRLAKDRDNNVATGRAAANAEHYLFAKKVSSSWGLIGYNLMMGGVPFYSFIKNVGQTTGLYIGNDPNATASGADQRYWGFKGAADGCP